MRKLTVRMLVVVSILTGVLYSGTEVFVGSGRSFARQQEAQEKQAGEQDVQILQERKVGADIVAPQIKQLTASRQGQALSGLLRERGFGARAGKDDFFGWEVEYRSKDGKTLKAKLILQNYGKPGSKGIAALASMTLASGDQTSTYEFSLIAPNGDVQKPEEYRVNENFKAERAHSLWSCFVARVRSQCVGVCISALATCPTSSWAAYLGCVAFKCGGCAAKALACCACNSSWWCRGAVGSCHQ